MTFSLVNPPKFQLLKISALRELIFELENLHPYDFLICVLLGAHCFLSFKRKSAVAQFASVLCHPIFSFVNTS